MATPDPPEPPPKKLTLKRAEFERVNEPADAAASSGLEPTELLRLNRAHEKKVGYLYSPAEPSKKSRRLRDFFIVLVVGNALLCFFLGPTSVFGIAGMLIFSAGLAWAMFAVMEDY